MQFIKKSDEFIFTDCSIREYWDDVEKLLVDKDVNAAINVKRLGVHPEMPRRKAELLKRQKGKCPWCELRFLEWDVLEVDHIIPRALRGKDEWKNLQLLHRHCHDEKTAQDLIEIRKNEHSSFLKKLAQQWSKFEWEWINDIPVIKGRAVKESYSDKGSTLSSRVR